MELLPGQVDSFIAGKRIEHASFDGMDDFLRRACRRHKIEPAAGRQTCVIELENVPGNRVAAAKAVEKPSVQPFLLQGILNGCDERLMHFAIIPPETERPCFTVYSFQLTFVQTPGPTMSNVRCPMYDVKCTCQMTIEAFLPSYFCASA